jgi:hypothetical protein
MLLLVAAMGLALLVVSPAGAQSAARIHLIHGIPNTAVDVEAGGANVFTNFQFGQTQDLSALAGNTLAGLKVKLAGTSTVAIDAGNVSLPASGNYTIIAHLDAAGTPKLAVFQNDTSTIAAGKGRLVVRHTAKAPAVDVLAGGQPVFTNLTNPNEVKADLAAGTVSASVVPAGATTPVVIGPTNLSIQAGSSLIVYAVGALDGGTIGVLTESISGLGAAPTAVRTGNSPVSSDNGMNVVLVGGAALLAAGTLGGIALAAARRPARVKA